VTRRACLGGIGIGLSGALAACSGDSESTTTSRTEQTPTVTETIGHSSRNDLDLREANVVDVTAERSSEDYRFSVTLIHDDDGEDGYANLWQVETRAGDRLGRRDLLHAHGTRAFTRSATIPIPESVSEVVVRGHDQIHGYGGQAMLVRPATGETEPVSQGPEPDTFSR
jgi:hypothetical protein